MEKQGYIVHSEVIYKPKNQANDFIFVKKVEDVPQ
jgi:hypothetical protein